MLLGSNTELVVERVMPNLLHIVPVCDDTVLDGVLEGQNSAITLRFVTDVRVLGSHSCHYDLNETLDKASGISIFLA